MAEAAHRVLIVDDDPLVAETLAAFVRAEGFEPALAARADEALALLDAAERGGLDRPPRPFALAVLDVALPGTDGGELLRRMAREHRAVAVIMLTGYGTIESAVACLRGGAVDYLTKPMVESEFRLALERAVRHHTLMAENQRLRGRLEPKQGLSGILGSDHRMLKTFELIEAVAPSRTTVLMTGESGTGKSLVARAIHERSPRRDKPFVEISCGSIPETLLESELFGHVKGAFTGAHANKAGRFLAADQGTIFLDEINSASPGMQLKLLRVLQERQFEPVGSTQTVEVDVRVVLASNQPLEALVADGRFRQDLYYRINVVTIELPPLRERLDDVPALAEHFLAERARELGKQILGFSPEAMSALRRYRYPGNVRELQNIVERAAVLTRGPIIGVGDLPAAVLEPARPAPHPAPGADDADAPWVPMPLDRALQEPERQILLRALRANNWNRQRTADQLQINRTTLYKKMKQHGLDPGHDRLAG